jgi:hypothetical protein
MTIEKVLAVAALLALASVPFSQHAQATVLTFGADFEFSGGTAPAGSAPWFTATFDDHGGVGSVDFTLTATNLTAAENVLSLYLNLDPALYGTLPVTFGGLAQTGSFDTPSISQGVDAFKADGDGFYDILLSFSSGGNVNKTFTQGDILEYTISAPGLTATSFDFLSAPAGGHGPFHLAAHIQNTGGGEDSGWVTDSTGGSLIVPEPTSATLALLAMSMLLVALSRHWRRQFS